MKQKCHNFVSKFILTSLSKKALATPKPSRRGTQLKFTTAGDQVVGETGTDFALAHEHIVERASGVCRFVNDSA